jgi:surface protein
MISIFYGCRVLKSLDLSKWNVGNATTIWWMFNTCMALESLNLSNWHLTNCIDYTDPFKNCKVLNNIIMKNSDYETVNNIISVLPTKTAAAPGTIVIDGVDSYDQVDLATAQAKYWNVEYTYDMSEFNKKVVSVEQLNNFAIKFNKKIKTEIVSIDTGVEETDLMTMLSEIYGDNQEE